MQQPAIESTARATAAFVVALLVVVAGMPTAAAGTQGGAERPTLTDCRTIDEPGEYTIGGNVTADGDCFAVTADGVTLDGGGHTIAGDGDWTAIIVADADGVTVRNVTLANWSTGVALRGAADARVLDTTVTGAAVDGVSIDGAYNATVRNSTVTDASVGVRVRPGSDDATVVGTEFVELYGPGVDLRGDDGRVVDSSFRSTGGAAVRVTAVDDALIANNTVRQTIGGISVAESAGVTVRANTLRNVQGASIRVAGDGDPEPVRNRPRPGHWDTGVTFVAPAPADLLGDRSTGSADPAGDDSATPRQYVDVTLAVPTPPEPVRVVDNAVFDTNGNGIFVTNATATTVAENLVVRSRDGVRIANGSDATLRNNTARANRDDGITVAASAEATLRNNTVLDNADDGLYVVSDDAVVLDTLARGNGDDGVDVQNSTLVAIRGNGLFDNGDDGLLLRNVVNATVELNEARGNGDDGIDLRGTENAVVVNNTLCGNTDLDLVERPSANATAAENNAC